MDNALRYERRDLRVRVSPVLPIFNRSMVYVVVPGTPNPKNPVQLGMLLPMGELSILEIGIGLQNRKCGSDSHLALQISQWLCRQTGYSRLPLKEEREGSSPSRAAISNNAPVDKLVIVTRFSSWNLRVQVPPGVPCGNATMETREDS